MAVNGRLPRWTDSWDGADVAPTFSDPTIRQTVIADQPTLPLPYYEQRISVPDGWDDQIIDPVGTVRHLVEFATTA